MHSVVALGTSRHLVVHANGGGKCDKGNSGNNSSSNMSVKGRQGLSAMYSRIVNRIMEIRMQPGKNGTKIAGNPVIDVGRQERGIAGSVGGQDEQVAKVVDDDVDPTVKWEQRVKDVRAEKRRLAVVNPGFSFSAAGLLFPYHLGVCECLLEHNYITDDTPLAGSSAGALVCAVISCGVSLQEAFLATKVLAEDCRLNGTAFRLGAVLRKMLEQVLPEDAHFRASGRIRVAITQVFRVPRGLLVDHFDSREDLIDALVTSCWIPGYLAPRPVTIFKNKVCMDGGFTFFMPPTAAETTVRVCAFSARQLGLQDIVGISPDCNPENRASVRQLFNWALEPAGDEMLDELYKVGYKDALVWIKANPLIKFRNSNQLRRQQNI